MAAVTSRRRAKPYKPMQIPDELPETAALWTLSDHAKERAQQRLFSQVEVLLAACDPDVTTVSGVGVHHYRRGDCLLVVNPAERVVLTVSDANSEGCKRVDIARSNPDALPAEAKLQRGVSTPAIKSLTSRIRSSFLPSDAINWGKINGSRDVGEEADHAANALPPHLEEPARNEGTQDVPTQIFSEAESPPSPESSSSANSINLGDGIIATYEEVTPAQAKAWLDVAREKDHNRHIRQTKVEQFAHDMLRGHWENNGESIKFDTEGILVDGQHRLSAIKEARMPLKMWVVRGVKPEAIHTIDTGVPRRHSDVLKLLGLQGDFSSVQLGALHRRLFMYVERGIKVLRGAKEPVSSADLLEFEGKYRVELMMAMSRGMDAKRHAGFISPATAGAAYFMLARAVISKGEQLDAVNEFWEFFISGAELKRGSPILPLRYRMAKARDEKLSEDAKIALIIMAWNYWRQKRSIESLNLPRTLLNDSSFPEPE